MQITILLSSSVSSIEMFRQAFPQYDDRGLDEQRILYQTANWIDLALYTVVPGHNNIILLLNLITRLVEGKHGRPHLGGDQHMQYMQDRLELFQALAGFDCRAMNLSRSRSNSISAADSNPSRVAGASIISYSDSEPAEGTKKRKRARAQQDASLVSLASTQQQLPGGKISRKREHSSSTQSSTRPLPRPLPPSRLLTEAHPSNLLSGGGDIDIFSSRPPQPCEQSGPQKRPSRGPFPPRVVIPSPCDVSNFLFDWSKQGADPRGTALRRGEDASPERPEWVLTQQQILALVPPFISRVTIPEPVNIIQPFDFLN